MAHPPEVLDSGRVPGLRPDRPGARRDASARRRARQLRPRHPRRVRLLRPAVRRSRRWSRAATFRPGSAVWLPNIVLGALGVMMFVWRDRVADQPIRIPVPALAAALGGSGMHAWRAGVLRILDRYVTASYLRFLLLVVAAAGRRSSTSRRSSISPTRCSRARRRGRRCCSTSATRRRSGSTTRCRSRVLLADAGHDRAC